MLGFEAAFDPGAYRVKLAHLKERIGLNFDYLAAAELPLSSDGLEAARDRVRVREDYRNLSL
jgi:endonuclease G